MRATFKPHVMLLKTVDVSELVVGHDNKSHEIIRKLCCSKDHVEGYLKFKARE